MVAIFVDRLGKRPITILVRDIVITRELVPLFFTYIVHYISVPETIVFDTGPQFVLDF